MKRKNLQPRIFYPAKLAFRLEGERKEFTDKQKLKKSSAPLKHLYKKCSRQFSKWKGKTQTKNIKIMTGKVSLGKANTQ